MTSTQNYHLATRATYVSVNNTVELLYFFDQTPQLLFISLQCTCFCAVTIWGWRFFLWQTCRHQRWLDKVCTSDTVMTVARCQQPLSTAVNRESYNTNSPIALTQWQSSEIICIYVCATNSSFSYYLRVVFTSLRGPDCAAIVWGQQLFKSSVYLKVVSIRQQRLFEEIR